MTLTQSGFGLFQRSHFICIKEIGMLKPLEATTWKKGPVVIHGK